MRKKSGSRAVTLIGCSYGITFCQGCKHEAVQLPGSLPWGQTHLTCLRLLPRLPPHAFHVPQHSAQEATGRQQRGKLGSGGCMCQHVVKIAEKQSLALRREGAGGLTQPSNAGVSAQQAACCSGKHAYPPGTILVT